MFNFFKTHLHKIYATVSTGMATLFARATVSQELLDELEKLLITADVGVTTSTSLIQNLKKNLPPTATGADCKALLEKNLLQLLTAPPKIEEAPIHLLIGINGSGKTTFAGKLANHYATHGKKVLLVAADTFRAAAPAQLQEWAKRSNTNILMGKEGQDPASLVFEACELFKQGTYDKLIIDTAGRLQTKINLMKELEKITKIISRQLPEKKIQSLLVLDAMLGQNSFEQAKMFNEITPINGIVLTKMDGTAKGGIVFAISQLLNIPIAYISYGEKIDDMQLFDAHTYVTQLLGS